MPWKMDGETVVTEGGNPVYEYDDGKEIAVDWPRAMETIAAANKEAKTHREAREAAEKKLQEFSVYVGEDGKPLDPAEVRKAVDTHKLLSEKKLLEAGEVQKLKDEAERAVTQRYVSQVEERDKKIADLTKAIEDKEKGWAFTTSKFVTEKITYPPPHALQVFGHAFKPENGKLVGYYNGELIMSRKTIGQPAEFDEAMEFIVEKDPFKERYLVNDAGGGAGTQTSASRPNKNAAELAGLPPTDRMAAAWGAPAK